MVAPEVEIYEFLDSNGFPIDEMYDGQRLGKRDEPNFISPRPGCFGVGKWIFAKFPWGHQKPFGLYSDILPSLLLYGSFLQNMALLKSKSKE